MTIIPTNVMSNGYECAHCGQKAVYWQCDFDFEDFGYEGQGIVQIYSCRNCGAEIEYRVPIADEVPTEPDKNPEDKLNDYIDSIVGSI